MNEETFVSSGPAESTGWDGPELPAEPSTFESRGLEDRIDQLESALGSAMAALARQEAVISTTGFAHQIARDMGRPEGAAILAQEMAALPGLSEAVARYPILGEMAKAWAAQKLTSAPGSSGSPLPTSLTGGQGQTGLGSAKQKQLAVELQKMATDLGISLEDQDAMEVYADV
jgi:hypothetical protein